MKFLSLDETAERSIVSIGFDNKVGPGSTSSLGEESLVTVEFLNEDGLPQNEFLGDSLGEIMGESIGEFIAETGCEKSY